MRPVLMIEGLRNLHDARYCAAVGIGLVSFEMEPESPGYLAPPMVREIIEWLSGLDAVGSFRDSPAWSIEDRAQASTVRRVMVPLDYPAEELKSLDFGIVLDATKLDLNLVSIEALSAKSQSDPKALILVALGEETPQKRAVLLANKELLSHMILRCDDPDTIYHLFQANGIQPYGFSLGAFSSSEDGMLDYDACDAFIEAYQELAIA